jgi:Flp pilus assembly protein TadG
MILPKKICRDRSGAAAIEFAILAPVAMLLLFGTYEFTNALVAYMKLTAAVDTVGDLVAQQTGVTDATIDDFYTAEQLVMEPLSASGLGLAVASVTFNSSGTPVLAWQKTRGGAVPMTDVVTVSAGLGNAGDSVILAQATYTYNSPIKYLLSKGIPMTERVFTRPRLVPSIPFTN